MEHGQIVARTDKVGVTFRIKIMQKNVIFSTFCYNVLLNEKVKIADERVYRDIEIDRWRGGGWISVWFLSVWPQKNTTSRIKTLYPGAVYPDIGP